MKSTHNDNKNIQALPEAQDPSLKPNITGKSGFAAFRTYASELATTWVKRKKLYMELMTLDERQLSSLGLSRYDIPTFANKSFRSTETKVASSEAETLTYYPEQRKAA